MTESRTAYLTTTPWRDTYQTSRLHFFVPVLPPRELSPNGRFHWARRAAQVKNYRNSVGVMAGNARQLTGWPAPAKARMKLTFIFRSATRRDPDNLLASFKSGIDGMVDGGVIIGDDSERLIIKPPEIVVSRRLESGVHIVVEAI